MRAHPLQETALRYFLEVARCGSLTEASARLHVAASALSRQIQGLESALGATLFERHARGMVLTEVGEVLALHARRAQLDAERALDEIGALRGLRAGQVRLATSDAFANEFVPQLCTDFQRTHQGIQFSVQVLPTALVPTAVRAATADIGLCFSRAPEKDIDVAYRQRAPVLALVPPGHALACARRLSLADMVRYPLALPPAETTVRQLVDIVASRLGLRLAPVLESSHARAMLHFAASGAGVSVASEITARHMVRSGELVALPLGDPGMDLRDIEVQTLLGRELPPAAQAFLQQLCERLAQP